MGSKDYNIIMHFNGWDFDEKMLMARLLLHGLAEEYIGSLGLENEYKESQSKYDFNPEGRMKMKAGTGLF